jgi:hypothetical protein
VSVDHTAQVHGDDLSEAEGQSPVARLRPTRSLRVGERPQRSSTVAKPVNTCGCGELSAKSAVGPFIRCTGYEPTSDSWTGTVLFACHPGHSETPTVTWVAAGGSPTVVPGEHLDTWAEWNFWRFELVIPMTSQQQAVRYWVNNNSADASTFYVAGEEARGSAAHQGVLAEGHVGPGPWHHRVIRLSRGLDVAPAPGPSIWQAVQVPAPSFSTAVIPPPCCVGFPAQAGSSPGTGPTTAATASRRMWTVERPPTSGRASPRCGELVWMGAAPLTLCCLQGVWHCSLSCLLLVGAAPRQG